MIVYLLRQQVLGIGYPGFSIATSIRGKPVLSTVAPAALGYNVDVRFQTILDVLGVRTSSLASSYRSVVTGPFLDTIVQVRWHGPDY